ncbi:hypothetical protein Q3G72_030837 [Acer saccharum]|nr:hypothetical protein Q3G72_030837 [Acer saccharum]
MVHKENSVYRNANQAPRLCPSIDVKAEVTRRSCGYTNDTVLVPYLVLMKEEGMTLSILAAVSGTILLPEIFVDLFLFMLLICDLRLLDQNFACHNSQYDK